jgi:hypothetical protein
MHNTEDCNVYHTTKHSITQVCLNGIKSYSPCTSSLANTDRFKSASYTIQLLLADKNVYLNSIHTCALMNNLTDNTNTCTNIKMFTFSYNALRFQNPFRSCEHPQEVGIKKAYINTD